MRLRLSLSVATRLVQSPSRQQLYRCWVHAAQTNGYHAPASSGVEWEESCALHSVCSTAVSDVEEL